MLLEMLKQTMMTMMADDGDNGEDKKIMIMPMITNNDGNVIITAVTKMTM